MPPLTTPAVRLSEVGPPGQPPYGMTPEAGQAKGCVHADGRRAVPESRRAKPVGGRA